MSNPVVLETKEFKNKQGEISHGYTLSDCYEQCYDDSLESRIDDDLELLTYVVNNSTSDIAGGILDSLVENEKGITINDSFYDYEEIKDILIS